MENVRRNLSSDSEDASISSTEDVKISSFASDGPTNDDNRTCRCKAVKSCDESPLIQSMVKKKLILLPGGNRDGTGELGRVEAADPDTCLEDIWITLEILRSTLQDPIASAV
jgi:hypothetical protein